MDNQKFSFSPLQTFLRTFQKIKEKAGDVGSGLRKKMSGVEQHLEQSWEHREETLEKAKHDAATVKEKLMKKARTVGKKLSDIVSGTTPIPVEKTTKKRVVNAVTNRKKASESATRKTSSLTRKLSRTKAKV